MSGFNVCTEFKTFNSTRENIVHVCSNLNLLSAYLKHEQITILSSNHDQAELEWKGMGKIKVHRNTAISLPYMEYQFTGLMGYTVLLRIKLSTNESSLCVESESQIPLVFRSMIKPQVLQFQNQIRDALCAIPA